MNDCIYCGRPTETSSNHRKRLEKYQKRFNIKEDVCDSCIKKHTEKNNENIIMEAFSHTKAGQLFNIANENLPNRFYK